MSQDDLLTILLVFLTIQSLIKAVQITKKEYFSDPVPENNQIADEKK